MIEHINLHNHGCYECGGQLFHSKLQAILHDERYQPADGVRFKFNDEIYSQYNWSIEPTETLEQLYLRRAIELREKYDYLVLHFSGGNDSCQILETFVDNNIKIDEIFIRGSIASSVKEKNNDPRNSYAEIFFQSVPLAEMVKAQHWPDLKIRVLDVIPYTLKAWADNPNWIDSHEFNHFTPSVMWRMDYDELCPDYKQLTDAGLTIGHITGIEKPGIAYENGKYIVRFLDKLIAHHMPKSRRDNQMPLYIEPFFWSKSTAPLIIKQAHAIKNHIKKHNLDPTQVFKPKKERTVESDVSEFISRIIYKRRLPLLMENYAVLKPSQDIFQFDWFFFEDKQSQHYRNWKMGMDHLQQTLPTKYLANGSVFDGLKGMYSQSYDIGS